ncbi:sulfotransferase family 2 domain-containing protein [Cytobacillus oceanisediminis]|uniref:Sulfotransferase family protein n=1 Tax=Cytobacillus oceanisediminis TaxID=665099 RepID=A0A562K557_9BACI|nr:sulfotransferase family 2 domain-containing protein [Cytobacillus oceanisediminis]TWH90559.1 sulfotransferase family protein [Cytobacillus oceanisediminis]
MKKIIIFIHIPKTAGTSMRKIIEKQYNVMQRRYYYNGYQDAFNRLKGTPQQKLNTVKWVQGHFQFGLHEAISNPVEYIAMLRHPVDRVISYYYFLRENPRHPLHQKAKSLHLKDFIMSEENIIQDGINNLQTTLISGEGTPSFEKAKKNIDEHFMMVGLTERFNESLFLMRKKLKWYVPYSSRHNVTRSRPKMSQVSEDVKKIIEQKNEFDFQLYEYGKAIFQKHLEELDPAAQQELRKMTGRTKL